MKNVTRVKKRDGRNVKFDRDKIRDAVMAAFNAVDGEITSEAKRYATNIADYIQESPTTVMHVEEIQDIVRDKLMSSKRKDVAEQFVIYRQNRNYARENTIDKTVDEIVQNESEYWNEENSNKNPRRNTTIRDYIAGAVSTDVTRRRLLNKDIVDAHDQGIIHFHDADYFIQKMYNCCLINIEDMLQNGTVISNTYIDKPTTFSTACNIATQIIAQVASSQYGGQSISIAHLSPFVNETRKTLKKKNPDFTNEQIESLVKQDIEDGVQIIQYQIVTLMTTNGQAPFITVYLNINEVEEGQSQDDLALVIEEVLKQRIKGVKNEKGVYITPAFPKLIYLLDENNVYKDSKYYYLTELAAKCSAKRLVPDYISAKVMKEYKNGDVYTCMGCRSFLTPDRTKKNYANAFNYDKYAGHKYYGRFNQGVVTINLVDVACSSKKDMDKFWEILEERLELCHRALRARHDRLEGTTTEIAPILWEHGAIARLPKGSKIDELLFHGYSTISLGYAGLYEMCVYMTGVSHTDPKGEPFALAVMQKLNDKCNEWKKQEDIDYSVYGTPIESVTYKFAKCLQERFGIIKDVTDHDYITNSYHVNVREKIDAFNKLKFEAKFQQLSPGGAISYIETPNMQDNIQAVMSVIQYIYENIMYAELNTKSDYCQMCGYDGEIQIIHDEKTNKLVWECPNCGNRDQERLNVARRTCGYIGNNFWNQGRTEEIQDRVIHMSNKTIQV